MSSNGHFLLLGFITGFFWKQSAWKRILLGIILFFDFYYTLIVFEAFTNTRHYIKLYKICENLGFYWPVFSHILWSGIETGSKFGCFFNFRIFVMSDKWLLKVFAMSFSFLIFVCPFVKIIVCCLVFIWNLAYRSSKTYCYNWPY